VSRFGGKAKILLGVKIRGFSAVDVVFANIERGGLVL
jgi:hypothetical protein